MNNSELIKAIRDEDKGLGEHAMLSARIIHNSTVIMQVAYLQWKNRNQADEAMVHIEGLLEDTDNIPAEGYAGCGDISNTANPMVYFRNNHLSGDLSPYQSRIAPLIDDLERRMVSLQKSMDLMTAERDHWKANHDYRVHAAKLLIDRPDCPLERVKAYKRHVELIADVESYVSINTELATELAKLREQEPVAFWWIGPDGKDNGGPYSGKPSEAAIDRARNMGCEAHLLYSDPVPAPAVTYGIDAEAANRISLAVYDWKKGINPEPLLYAINRILATEAHPLSAEGQRAMLQSSPKAPAVPEEWRKVMAELTADLQAACDAEHPHRDQYPSVMRRYNNDMEIVEKARALLQSALQSPAVPNLVESHQIKAPDCQTCANRGRVDGLSQETHCEHCCHQPSIGLTSHYAPISESVLALNEADSSESAQDGMILMPREADERLVAGFVGCETREEAMLGWEVAVRTQEISTGQRKPVDPECFLTES